MEECIELSKKVAQRIWEELKMPVTLYEESASAPHRRNLAAIRKGQFEGMPEKLQDPKWYPDYGNHEIHPTAGIVAVGARFPLVAFNINLSTSDVEIANKIAKTIRESSGGMRWVKSIGVMLEERNTAQVSINMTNYTKTPIYRVYETVRFEAARYGVQIIGSELIGIVPMDALTETAEYYLKLENFDKDNQIIKTPAVRQRDFLRRYLDGFPSYQKYRYAGDRLRRPGKIRQGTGRNPDFAKRLCSGAGRADFGNRTG